MQCWQCSTFCSSFVVECRNKSCTEILKKNLIVNSCHFCHALILKVGKIIKNGWISTSSKLEDATITQLKIFLVWNLGNEYARNQLGSPGGWRFFLDGPKLFQPYPILLNYVHPITYNTWLETASPSRFKTAGKWCWMADRQEGFIAMWGERILIFQLLIHIQNNFCISLSNPYPKISEIWHLISIRIQIQHWLNTKQTGSGYRSASGPSFFENLLIRHL